MALTQDNRWIRIKTPLGANELLVMRASMAEELGRLFEMELDLVSESPDHVGKDIVGQGVTVEFDLPGGAPRYFHGIVSRFAILGKTGRGFAYAASVRPWTWLLGRTSDCRIFQQKKAPQIIEQVFKDAGFSDYRLSLSAQYREWEYCVQYRETDFNFVSRLMEQEGMYYYFEHDDGKHTLVVADSPNAHSPFPDYADIPYYPPDAHAPREKDYIFEWTVSEELQTGAYVLDDFDFTKPSTDLKVSAQIRRDHTRADYEFYDYPGEYTETSDGDHYVDARIEEHAAQYERVQGAGCARGLAVGRLFKLEEHPHDAWNAEYLVVSAVHELQADDYQSGGSRGATMLYSSRFTAIPSKTQFRTRRLTPKPFVQGPQTAIVVGPSGEEIWTDEHGRVKVQFHWDREGKKDENSSCWVRVSQLWAGKTWGAMFIPRMGQEVIVDFLEGDPDRPIVTGRVYNAEQKPPYELPANKTQSGVKTRSSKEGDGATFNELRFEDKKGEEQIYFHAEKNFDRVVENDDTLKVGFEKKDKGDQTIEVFNNQTLKVGAGEGEAADGSQTVEVYKDRSATLKTGSDTLTIDEGDRTTKITKGKRTTTIKQDDKLTIQSGNLTIDISAGKATMTAAQSIELKVGGSSIKIEPAKITVKSVQVTVEGSAKAEVKGAMVDINGSAMVKIQGGLVKIN